MATVGYLEGTDPLVLTELNLRGIGTLPLGNGYDGHGKYIGHITKSDNLTVVVGYLHKILPTGTENVDARSFLFACHTNDIPIVLIAPADHHDETRNLLGDIEDWVDLSSPPELLDAIAAHIDG